MLVTSERKPAQTTFSLADAETLTGVNRVTIRAWADRGFIVPDTQLGSGKGSRCGWSDVNLLEIFLARVLRDLAVDLAGITPFLEAVRRSSSLEEIAARGPGFVMVRGADGTVRSIDVLSREQLERATGVQVGVGMIAESLLGNIRRYQAASAAVRRNGEWRND